MLSAASQVGSASHRVLYTIGEEEVVERMVHRGENQGFIGEWFDFVQTLESLLDLSSMRDVGHLDQVIGEQNGQFGGVFVDLRYQDAVGVFNIRRA